MAELFVRVSVERADGTPLYVTHQPIESVNIASSIRAMAEYLIGFIVDQSIWSQGQ